jgi:hypothetical protein
MMNKELNMKSVVKYVLVNSKTLNKVSDKRFAYRKVAERHAAERSAKKKDGSKVVAMTEHDYLNATRGKGEWKRDARFGNPVWVAHDTPRCCDPSSELYWSM